MQSNKILQAVTLLLMMLFSMLAISSLLEVNDSLRNVILGVGIFIVILFFAWRNIRVDAKLLFIVILGYALGGKGFAYISPFEPIYIGEISLSLCALGYLARPRQFYLLETPIHRWIWVYVLYAGLHLIVDYTEYRLLALRDSSMAYYSLFFIISFSLFQNETIINAFQKVIKIVVVFAAVSVVFALLFYNLRFPGFSPHVDAYMPLCAGLILYSLVIGIEKAKVHYAIFACIVLVGLATTKTATLLALVAVVSCAILCGGLRKLIMPSLIVAALGLVSISTLAFINAELVVDLFLGGQTGEAFGLDGGDFVGFSGTSELRLLWWTTVCVDTVRDAPFWGQGFGADITGPFLEAWLGAAYADPTGYARYPHNVMITNFGRLGYIGLGLFSILYVTMGIFVLKFCRRFFSSPDRRDADLVCFSIVVAGMVNSVLQSTYEVPYAAITHWVCLGYMAARFYLFNENTNVGQGVKDIETIGKLNC
jgi:hypothetical protein